MVTIPAFVWRGGFVRRAVTIGATAGLCFGFLSWLDSGFVIAGVMVFVVVGSFYGIWMARRMTRYWPESASLGGDERVAVVRAARHGERVDDDRLAQPVAEYRRGLRAAAETARFLRWVLVAVLVVAVATAAWDFVYGSWGNLIASVIYLVALALELFWWPKRQSLLLANADRAAAMSR